MTSIMRHSLLAAAVLLAAGGLAGCNTDGTPAPVAQAPQPPPLSRTDAAKQCWMAAEKGRRDVSLDKRADVVTKCIEDKLKAEATPES